MKKVLMLILLTVFMFTLTACKNEETTSIDDTSSITTTQNQDKVLDNYAFCMLVKINPEFMLYADKNNIVLDVRAMNDDAKSIINKIVYSNKNIEEVLVSIIQATNDAGFLTSNSEVKISIAEIRESDIDTSAILNNANNVADKCIKEIKNSHNEKSVENKVKGSNSNHVHVFSAATCTEPQKCTCGATKGKALGHTWKKATCLSPQTCEVCKITEGNKSSHNFVNGICTTCGIDNFVDPQKIVYEKEYIGNLRFQYGELVGSGVSFSNDDGIYCILLEPYYSEQQEYSYQAVVEYNGKKYYHTGAGMMPYKFNFEGKKIIVINPETNKSMVTFCLQSDNSLIVVESNTERYPVNTILK